MSESFSFIEDIADISKYDSRIPFERYIMIAGQRVRAVRRICNFTYTDVFGKFIKHLLIPPNNNDQCSLYTLTGQLIAPSDNVKSPYVKILVRNVLVMYGTDEKDEFRGIWVDDNYGMWYILTSPCHDSYIAMWTAITRKVFSPQKNSVGSFGKERITEIDCIAVYDSNGNECDILLLSDGGFYLFLLEGIMTVTLLGQPFAVNVVSYVDRYEFCLGRTITKGGVSEMVDRGLWLREASCLLWFRVLGARPTYREIYSDMCEDVLGSLTHVQKQGAYEKLSSIFREHYFSITNCSLCHAQGLHVPFVFTAEEQEVFLLQGLVLGKDDDQVHANVSAFVNRCVLNLSDWSLHMRSCLGRKWFKIDTERLSTDYQCFFSPDVASLKRLVDTYDWNETGEEQWWHVRNFTLLNGKSCNPTPLLTSYSSKKSYILRGELIKPLKSPTDAGVALEILVKVDGYSIDYGRIKQNRGLWLKVGATGWYKVSEPSADYLVYGDAALAMTEKFLNIYDIIVCEDNDFSVVDHDTEMFVCNFAIKDIFKGTRGAIDLEFIADNKQFVMDNLEGDFDKERSKKLFSSIKILQKKEIKQFVLETKKLFASMDFDKQSSDSEASFDLEVQGQLSSSPATETTRQTASPSFSETESLDTFNALEIAHAPVVSPAEMRPFSPAEQQSPSFEEQRPFSPAEAEQQSLSPAEQRSFSPVEQRSFSPAAFEEYVPEQLPPTPLKTTRMGSSSIAKRKFADKEKQEDALLSSSKMEPKQDRNKPAHDEFMQPVEKTTPPDKSETESTRRDGFRIKQRNLTDVDEAPPVVTPSARSIDKTSRKLCTYCKKLEKHHKCNNAGHIDGHYLDESKLVIGYCYYCRGLPKHPKCNFASHIDGKTISRAWQPPLLSSTSSATTAPKSTGFSSVATAPLVSPTPAVLSRQYYPPQPLEQNKSFREDHFSDTESVDLTPQRPALVQPEKIDLSLVPAKSSLKRNLDVAVGSESKKKKVRFADEEQDL